MMKPICFMVMPFGTKDTGATPPAPAKINFDALWEKALLPAIETLGYRPVRADQDLGGLIIQDMLERLYFSDLVVADMTIPNGNVYYEVGVRHAAKNAGCVLISADWSRQLFDLNQVRQARYPLPEGEVSGETMVKIQSALTDAIPKLADGTTPVFQTLPGYPHNVVTERASVIREYLEELSTFQEKVRSVRHAPAVERKAQACALRDQFPAASMRLPGIALEIIRLLRDYGDWKDVLAYIEKLPGSISHLPIVREQNYLAQSKTGDHLAAIGALEELIRTSGDSSEREGLIGGRYKKLYSIVTDPEDKARYLNKAIEHYERGMMLDLNDYYPSCNLPSLYCERKKRGDKERARTAAAVARLACRRAIQRQTEDEWTRPTLLGLAFFEGNVKEVKDLYDQIRAEGYANWKLEVTIDDLKRSVALTQNAEKRASLEGVLNKLKALLLQ